MISKKDIILFFSIRKLRSFYRRKVVRHWQRYGDTYWAFFGGLIIGVYLPFAIWFLILLFTGKSIFEPIEHGI